MPNKESQREWRVALVGALLGLVLYVAYNPKLLIDLGVPDSVSHLATIVFSSTISGWLAAMAFRLRRNVDTLSKATAKEVKELQSVNDKFMDYLKGFFDHDPYSLMTRDTPHSGVLGTLIKDSIGKGYMEVGQVDENKYLLYLQEAIANAQRYDGLQTEPMRWFQLMQNSAKYLEVLRDKEMTSKRRVFVISDDKVDEMCADLRNEDTLRRYWTATGTSMETYWIAESTLRQQYNIKAIDDCALYDNHLLIKYDRERQILQFRIVSGQDATGVCEPNVFDRLSQQLETRSNTPFIRVQEPNAPD